MAQIIVNSRSDIDALRGTPYFLTALEYIQGAMTVAVNVAEYSEGADPDLVEPVWEERLDLSILQRIGWTRAEFEAEIAAARAG